MSDVPQKNPDEIRGVLTDVDSKIADLMKLLADHNVDELIKSIPDSNTTLAEYAKLDPDFLIRLEFVLAHLAGFNHLSKAHESKVRAENAAEEIQLQTALKEFLQTSPPPDLASLISALQKFSHEKSVKLILGRPRDCNPSFDSIPGKTVQTFCFSEGDEAFSYAVITENTYVGWTIQIYQKIRDSQWTMVTV